MVEGYGTKILLHLALKATRTCSTDPTNCMALQEGGVGAVISRKLYCQAGLSRTL